MKYAVPVSGGRLSSHFGHCEQFALFEVDEGKKEIVKRELLSSPEHQPGLLPNWLAQKGVNTVLAGGMGPRAVDIFNENSISVVLGTLESDPEQAVLAHLAGTLATGENVCDH